MSTAQQVESWHRTLAELGPRQREVIDLLIQFPPGLSAWQMSIRSGRMIHVIRPRITELAKEGIITQRGEVWHEETQRHEAVWVYQSAPQLTLI